MSWDSSIGKLTTKLPQFNDYLLRGYRQDQINRFPDFVETIFKEAVQLFNGKLSYLGYNIMNPEMVIEYSVTNPLVKGRFNIQRSELQLYEYLFRFEDKEIKVHLYLPYLYQGALVINDTRYYFQLPIVERTIYRSTESILIKVMRSPLQFWRSEQFQYKNVRGETYRDTIITVKAFYRRSKSSKVRRTPLVLYFLAHYGFEYTITEVLGLPPTAISFVETADPHDDQYDYFQVRENIYLKVDREQVMFESTLRRFVASVLYILNMTKRCTMADVYNVTFYKMILGRNLHNGNEKEALAAGHADSHLESLRTYLDVFSKEELALMHIYCNDIFELFTVVFFNIDTWLKNYNPNDLFVKRIGGADLLLKNLVETIFNRFYTATTAHNKKLDYNSIRRTLSLDPMKITVITSVDALRPNNDLYNDNTLTSTLVKRLRPPSRQDNSRRNKKSKINLITAAEHQFHPSFIAIESPLAISSSSPGVTGDINPFAAIDDKGFFLKEAMPWYDDIYPLIEYLVNH